MLQLNRNEINAPSEPEVLFNESNIESQLPVQRRAGTKYQQLKESSSPDTQSSLIKITFQIKFHTNVGQSLLLNRKLSVNLRK